MATQRIDPERIQLLNDADVVDGKYTLYWMQQSQRARLNHALEYAAQRANANGQRLVVGFGLTAAYPDANLRHFHFMLEGLQQTQSELSRRQIPLVVRLGDPAEVALELAENAAEVICDRGYLCHQLRWRSDLAAEARCRVTQVESDAIVPVEVASDKQEYAARTIRPRLHEHFERFLKPLRTTAVDKHSLNVRLTGEDVSNVDKLLQRLDVDRSVPPVEEFAGGTSAAKQRLNAFLDDSINHYRERTSLLAEHVSHLSPYLHFGQLSPLEAALAVRSQRGVDPSAKEDFVEELLVRRELAINFVHYSDNYDDLAGLPEWAQQTLAEHEDDPRDSIYTAAELENAETHDAAWNASMIEMKRRGYLHNYLRMYWGKKIIEWTNTAGHAYRTILRLNNKYFLDGRDANSYANVLWLFGQHDRAHQERPIFGKLRYMSAGGLKRKYDPGEYVRAIADRYEVDVAGELP